MCPPTIPQTIAHNTLNLPEGVRWLDRNKIFIVCNKDDSLLDRKYISLILGTLVEGGLEMDEYRKEIKGEK